MGVNLFQYKTVWMKVLREIFPSAILRLLDWKYRKSDVNAIALTSCRRKEWVGSFISD